MHIRIFNSKNNKLNNLKDCNLLTIGLILEYSNIDLVFGIAEAKMETR